MGAGQFYQPVAEHYETWLDLASAGQLDRQGDHHTPKPYVRQAFAKYLKYGIFAHGFTRARCDDSLELIDRIAALVPPPRTHRHRYFGVLAPHSPLRAAVTMMAQSAAAQPVQPAQVRAEPASTGAGEGARGASNPFPTQTEPAQPVPPKRPAHYLSAVLIARIYEVFPLLCSICGGQMRIIAFITHSADIRQILERIGVETELPRITPARGPPLWDECDA